MEGSECEASLGYTVIPASEHPEHRDPVSKKKTNKQKEQNVSQ